MTTTTTFVEILTERLKAAGFHIPVTEVDRLAPGPCQACDTDQPHPACAVVSVVLHVEPTEPPTRLDGWSVPVCWERLTSYLGEANRVECIQGFEIEVPRYEHVV